MDKLVITLCPRFAPERPGNGIQYCRFSIAVVTTEASDMNPIEGKGGHIIPIAHEILERQLNGDHFALLKKAALIVAPLTVVVNILWPS